MARKMGEQSCSQGPLEVPAQHLMQLAGMLSSPLSTCSPRPPSSRNPCWAMLWLWLYPLEQGIRAHQASHSLVRWRPLLKASWTPAWPPELRYTAVAELPCRAACHKLTWLDLQQHCISMLCY